MRISAVEIDRAAGETGFRPEPLEKAFHLLDLLEEMRGHPFLRDRLALKGGTAANLFVLALPRLSVDVDLNYIGALDRATMLAERPLVERAVEAVCSRHGLTVRRMPTEHAGGKWRLAYERARAGHWSARARFELLAPLAALGRWGARFARDRTEDRPAGRAPGPA
ncbi:MAG: nucleotidyl transferase AbiEii/AbiGii toxin family protein [Planctomycetota bacterium]